MVPTLTLLIVQLFLTINSADPLSPLTCVFTVRQPGSLSPNRETGLLPNALMFSDMMMTLVLHPLTLL